MKHRAIKRLSSARAVAADVVARVLDDDAFAQQALSSALSSSSMDARDKALCTELVYGTLRWAKPLEESLMRGADRPGRGLDKRIRPHLLVAAYQLQHLSERIPAHAAVSEAVDAVRAARPGLDGFANALLRRLGSAPHAALPASAPVTELARALGVPPLLADAVCAQVPPAEARDALLALNARPTTWAVAFGALPEGARAHPFVPSSFALEGGGAVTDDPAFAAGKHLVMDPGSAACALLVGARPGWRVLDLCAAPGGKTALLARAVGAGGAVIAVEKNARRAQKIGENVRRVGVDGAVRVVVKDALAITADDTGGLVDAVLLDAPCTGFGTVRRKPEIKLRRTDADVAALAAAQRALLSHAATLVKPGGVLVYSVCSPIPAEGAAQIEALLEATGSSWSIADARTALPWLPADAVDGRGVLRLLPHRHDADAFFAARLARR